MEITPGPWIIRTNKTKYPDIDTYTVLGRDTTPDSFCSGKYFTVAWELDSEADARLIAAAPELLAACQAALRWFRLEHADRLCVAPPTDELEAAIAKAMPGGG